MEELLKLFAGLNELRGEAETTRVGCGAAGAGSAGGEAEQALIGARRAGRGSGTSQTLPSPRSPEILLRYICAGNVLQATVLGN